ncbi:MULTISPECIES: Ig-like domain-containing protein [unclassified Maribacter]|uniref:Ig-like domain-containing protein n=1 Tax=unclassified Maribacter TaxID=2615042 RepID=UPI0025796C60|nr:MULTISPECIES: Ig-like domain-containing protein [unclassified Maribacter]|tara:strand:+ start:122973 stop:124589 length:1617 start_codon:yes stop_codon:yes gene_type:complete
MSRKILGFIFVFIIILVSYQCAQRGNPTGGPKDITAPELTRAEPPNMTTNFKGQKIRLYFNELVKLKDIQKQLIISPPLKNSPVLSPIGNANKYVEITIKDTLAPNTTYTLNFGQGIVDNNEENPKSFFTYVFSTGDYIDSLELKGVVKDAFNKKPDDFISVMLYKIDTSYTDSTIYKRPPNYITNTLDSAIIFKLNNLKEGKYALFGVKDAANNNLFDQKTDKIAFVKDTINLPTDSIYLLTLFKEIPDYSVAVPTMEASNKISFGYYGEGSDISINTLTEIPDTVKTIITKERDKDTLNFWFTPYEMDSLIFTLTNEKLKVRDTFKVKSRKVAFDSLKISMSQNGTIEFDKPINLLSNTPLIRFDSTKIKLMDKDSIEIAVNVKLDSLRNLLNFDFKIDPDQNYRMELIPGAVTDFFETTNDSVAFSFKTKSLADYGNLTLNLNGNSIVYPIIVQLTNEKGELQREIYATEPQVYTFDNLNPGKYQARVIFDLNGNGKWDTGNLLKKIQPEKISYYPALIELRANWEKIETFNLID